MSKFKKWYSNENVKPIYDIKDKNDYLSDIDGTKDDLWNKYFDIKNPIFKQKNYQFDYKISTDCFGISIQF